MMKKFCLYILLLLGMCFILGFHTYASESEDVDSIIFYDDQIQNGLNEYLFYEENIVIPYSNVDSPEISYTDEIENPEDYFEDL